MLAYELYLQNINKIKSASGKVSIEKRLDAGDGIPIKKIFVNKDKIEIDNKSIDKYGYIETSSWSKNLLQKKLDMPIDMQPELHLPKKLSTANLFPYITIYGSIGFCKKNKSQPEPCIELKRTKTAKPVATLLLSDLSTPQFSINKGIEFKPHTKDHFIGSDNLGECYKTSGILVNGELPLPLFKKIVTKFSKFLQERNLEWTRGRAAFKLYILPNKKKIDYKNETDDKQNLQDVDSFNNPLPWADSNTDNVTFMSYDNKAYTLNSKRDKEFYADVGIGKESHEIIIMPEIRVTRIENLDWYFTDLNDLSTVFTAHPNGIYYQLYKNFQQLKNLDVGGSCKAMCIRKQRGQREVIIDENLTMKRLESIFGNVNEGDIVKLAYELLILKKGKSTIYRYYIQAIKSLLLQTSIDRTQLIQIFTYKIHEKVQKWLKNDMRKNRGHGDLHDFFKQSEFCQKTLNYSNSQCGVMENEEFAKKVGIITRAYIDAMLKDKNYNTSLKGMLSKSKYDIRTLKSIIGTIGRGIHHHIYMPSDKYKSLLAEIEEHVVDNDPSTESDNKDLSYHFYMGYFRKAE